MSVSARLLSGTVASWAQIAITMVTQVVLVPLYLSYWSVSTYGLWLAIISFSGLLNSLDIGYQEYLNYEFLKIGKTDTRKFSKYLCSGVLFGVLLGLAQIVLVIVLYSFNIVDVIFKDSHFFVDPSGIRDAFIILFMQAFIWLICGSVGGLLNRALATFGYYPRMAWWAVFTGSVLNLAPAVAVILGANLLQTGITMALARIVTDTPVYFDMIRLLKREKISFVKPSIKLGWNNFLHSTFLSATGLLDNVRQQGARLFITPFTGSAGLAAFSTMRTGSNVALQGLRTIVNPLMPELMTFLHKKDQERTEVAFGTVWIVAIAVVAPALVVVQAFIQPLYTTWTRGKIPFDPWLFAVLSIGILVYAMAQPAVSIVRGNNLLRPQLIISAMSAAVTIGGIFITVPLFGILGAGVSLLAAEIAACIAFKKIANNWLIQQDLIWPQKSYAISLSSLCIASIAIAAMIMLPNKQWLIVIISLILLIWNTFRYWSVLPTLATDRAKSIISTVPGIKLLLPYL
ncbi:lipopolysaccharide biosynthesis protein [Pedobacter mucosus]|uniref:lipopolysaccharide biosynthesis protein n=1 Tax=Pedobacter mucosus TaxID=2895286 RepID=UPI001EE48C52|nr:hypothetical protein [Pedobacter mucosus]UKT62246.1 hypothetical protein LOK61_10780 [Pedobacter mucosus]